MLAVGYRMGWAPEQIWRSTWLELTAAVWEELRRDAPTGHALRGDDVRRMMHANFRIVRQESGRKATLDG